MLDATTLGGELAAMVKAQFSPVLERLEQRLTSIEKQLQDMPTPQDGKDADPAEVAALAAAAVRQDIEAVKALIPAPQESPDVAALVKEAVAEAVATIPAPEAPVIPDVEAIVKDAVAAIPAPEPLPDVDALVKAAVDAIPRPEAPALPDIGAMVIDAVEKAVKALPRAEDGAPGVGLAGALIDREGNLVVTLSNGEAKSLGPVVGRDGEGKDGADGIGFDDMTMDFDGERTFTFRFERGEKVVERKFIAPVVLDRGVFRSGSAYEKGDAVTYGGSLWIAQGETSEKPGTGAGWRLSVKAGRDGRDGVMKSSPDSKPLRLRGGNDAD